MMKKILCVVLMGVLGLSGSLWAVETPEREMPSFNLNDNKEEGGEIETKGEPAEDDVSTSLNEINRLLLDREADLDVPNNLGMTPLHWAALNRHVDVVRLLGNHGAGVTEESAPVLAPVPQVEEVENVEADGNAIDVGAIHDNGVGVTREQLLGALVLVGALTYSTGCNFL